MLTLHAKLSERQIYERKQTETKDHWKQFGPVSSDLCWNAVRTFNALQGLSRYVWK